MVVRTHAELDDLCRQLNALPDGNDESNEFLLVPAYVPVRPRTGPEEPAVDLSRDVPRRWRVD